MTQITNTRVIYKRIPQGLPNLTKDFSIVKEEIDLKKLPLKDGQVLVQNLWLSVDPYMRGRMRDPKIRSYVPAFKLDQVPDAHCVSVVVRSTTPKLSPGQLVVTFSGWENYSVIRASTCFAIDDKPGIPVSYYLGVLGTPGQTAYVGLYKIGQPKIGETIYVSGASGAVGQVVGQLAKAQGLRVVGSAGDDGKVQFLVDKLGFDAAFNYKKEPNLSQALKRTCPKGIDIYFDNVGGETLDTVLLHCNDFSRVILCGMISQYNVSNNPYRLKNIILVLTRRIRMEGFIVTDDYPKYQEAFMRGISQLIQENKIVCSESVVVGVENIPKALLDLFHGANTGKQLVQLAPKL